MTGTNNWLSGVTVTGGRADVGAGALVPAGAGLFLYNVIFKEDPKAETSEEEKAEQFKEPIPFQRAALAIGLFIILCAAALKHLHQ